MTQAQPFDLATAAGLRRAGASSSARSWHRSYLTAALVVDAVVLVAAVLLAETLRFGVESESLVGWASVTYTALGVAIATAWWAALQFYGASNHRIVGHGSEEYRRILRASLTTFGLLAIVSLALRLDFSRGYLAIAFPVGVAGLLIGRKLLRTRLANLRAQGHLMADALVIGSPDSAAVVERCLARHPRDGLRVAGVWSPSDPDRRALHEAITSAGAEAVIVTDTEQLGAHGLKELGWELNSLGVQFLVSPNVMDVSAPRITLRSVGNMPFLHLEKPQYEGATRWTKAAFDKVFAAGAVVALSPVFLAAALAVKLTSPGPVLYRSERIGVGGRPFQMLKFRSMVDGADGVRDALDSDVDGVLFKKRDDPRVTRVGAFMRRHSIDELPQFVNVLRGDMSVVGPRPPLRCEVEEYEGSARRRLLVKQGITGLWQVSGRSDLSWEESVRLDLDYVENWSLARDLQIVWRTARTVITGRGAY